MLKAVRNPQQAQQMMLQQISKKDPNMSAMLNKMMQSGVPANQALQQMIQNGQVDRATFNKSKDMYNQYGRFLPFTINDSEWQTLEQEFNNVSPTPSNNNQSNGFRF